MAIPVMTKEEIFSLKDINTIVNERSIDGEYIFSESELDDLVTQWQAEAVGYVKGAIIESFHAYIDEYSWKVIFKLYCKWQSLDQIYSTVEQALVQNAYLALVDYVSRINGNVTEQAKQNVTPNKIKNFSIVNPES